MEKIGVETYGWVDKGNTRKGAGGDVGASEDEVPAEITVTVNELSGAMEQAIYLYNRWPFIYDATEQSIATQFLKYQAGSFILSTLPTEMDPESLRFRLVGGLKTGSNMVLNFARDEEIEIDKFYVENFFPKELIKRSELFKQEVWSTLLKGEDPLLFNPSDSFKIVVITQSATTAPKTSAQMFRIKVVEKEKEKSAEENISEALGIKITFRNSKELLEDAFEGDLDKVKGWLEKGYDIESVDVHDHTALSESSAQGKNEVVMFLVQNGADPNKVNDKGRSPLWRASFSGQFDTIKLLLEYGADPDLKDKDTRETPSMIARDEKCRALIDGFDRNITAALKEKRKEEIKAKFEKRVKDATELNFLATEAIKRELIEKVEANDVTGLETQLNTIISEAIAHDEKPRGSVQTRDERGNTLLSLAVWKGNIAVVAFILEKYKEFDKEDEDLTMHRRVYTPFINTRDSKGWTPIAIAAFHNHKEICKLLMDNDADPSIPNQYRKNAFDVANEDCLSVLGERRAETIEKGQKTDLGSLAEMQTEISKTAIKGGEKTENDDKKEKEKKKGGSGGEKSKSPAKKKKA